jgi:hypothetical protein
MSRFFSVQSPGQGPPGPHPDFVTPTAAQSIAEAADSVLDMTDTVDAAPPAINTGNQGIPGILQGKIPRQARFDRSVMPAGKPSEPPLQVVKDHITRHVELLH